MPSERFMRKHYGASGFVESGEANKTTSEANPEYKKFLIAGPPESATKIFGVTCDEGWCQKIVCTGMYDWAADWLVAQLQGKPYAQPPTDGSGENAEERR